MRPLGRLQGRLGAVEAWLTVLPVVASLRFGLAAVTRLL